MMTQRTFVPAAGHDWFLPLYDPLTSLFGFEQARRDLVAQAALQPLHRVLDIGCGTGTLAVVIKTLHPTVAVTALDPDVRALARARQKALRAGASVRFDEGYSDALPYADGSFDRVFSSMMLHHLSLDEKLKTLLEVRRVLAPGGRFHMLDFAGPESSGGGRFRRWLHSHERMRDNDEQRILALIAKGGLVGARKVAERRLLLGTVAYYQALRQI